MKLNDSTDLYLLEAVGTVTDPRYPTSPASRTARQYAHLNRRPVKGLGAFMTTQNTVNIRRPQGEVDGTAYFASSAAADCPVDDAAGVGDIAGVVSPGSTTGGNTSPTGSPAFSSLGTAAAVIAAASVRWSVITDLTFPIPYDGTWPNFASIPADSFPVIRIMGNYTLDRSGRGALIVTGTFTTADVHDWEGIILAGDATSSSYDSGSGNGNAVRGIVVSGLNGTPFSGNQTLRRFHALYYPCWVRKANLALAYLTPVSRSRWDF